jgi:cytochrome c heme-lyase
MFYNALARKGKLRDNSDDPEMDEDDVANVVALHNNMNEKTWKQVCEWEKVIDSQTTTPKLLKFQGRPHDLSPKAMFKHYVLGHPLPYDRHDWTIVRTDGRTTVRYVIDYYYDESRAAAASDKATLPTLHDAHASNSLLIDVRPALDQPQSLWHRLVTMPYARLVARSTSYQPLPLRPTVDMKSQVSESVRVWEQIQKRRNQAVEQPPPDPVDLGVDIPIISEQEARSVVEGFAKVLRDCTHLNAKLKSISTSPNPSESDLAKARMDLNLCMGQILCPVQHTALTQELSKSSPGSQSNDQVLEAAMNSLTECVFLRTTQHAAAQVQHPHVLGDAK